jgi:hypothetical protein
MIDQGMNERKEQRTMDMNADERTAFREQLAHLTDAEVAHKLYLCGLVQRIDTELLAMKTLFGSPDPEDKDGGEQLIFEPPVDTQVTALQHLMQTELKRRFSAKASRQKLSTGGENHAQKNGNGTH